MSKTAEGVTDAVAGTFWTNSRRNIFLVSFLFLRYITYTLCTISLVSFVWYTNTMYDTLFFFFPIEYCILNNLDLTYSVQVKNIRIYVQINNNKFITCDSDSDCELIHLQQLNYVFTNLYNTFEIWDLRTLDSGVLIKYTVQHSQNTFSFSFLHSYKH